MSLLKQGSTLSRLLSSRTFLIVNFIILAFLFFSFGREFASNYMIRQEIDELMAEKEALEAKNSELSSFMSSVQTETYIEQEARIKLGLSKPGEKVVILSNSQTKNLTESEAGLDLNKVDNFSVPDLTTLANPLKWWYYFFDINKFDMIKIYGNNSS